MLRCPRLEDVVYALLVVLFVVWGWGSQQYEPPPPPLNIPSVNEACLTPDRWGHIPGYC